MHDPARAHDLAPADPNVAAILDTLITTPPDFQLSARDGPGTMPLALNAALQPSIAVSPRNGVNGQEGKVRDQMPDVLRNPWRGKGIDLDTVRPSANATGVQELLALCPAHAETPLTSCPALAHEAGIHSLWVKDERGRMGLGSFKALGAAYAIARAAEETRPEDWGQALTGRCFVAASAGNHGISVAAGARIFGARAVIYIAETVPESFADRLAGFGAEVVRAGADYEASMDAAAAAAQERGWTLLSDSTWPGYIDPAMRVMEGYLQMAAEMARQVPSAPTHILLQAGVGGMAAAVAAHARKTWGDTPKIIVVEPAFAPALQDSIRAGALVTSEGPVSTMGRLDCKTPSLVALAGLSRDADLFATISEAEAAAGAAALASQALRTTPSGAAGVAAVLAGLPADSSARVLAILSEGPEDG